MCIIVCKPLGKTVSKATLEQCFNANSHGAGFMASAGNELIVEKGFFNFEDFYTAYKEHEDKRVVAHFRIATHGNTDKENCHPFVIDENMAFVHNGIISIEEKDKNHSDTYHFNELIIKPMHRYDKAFIRRPFNQELIKKFIGNSKLVFMDKKGRCSIINADKGIWEDGVWYSNASFRIPKPVVHYPQQKQLSLGNKSIDFAEGEMVQFRYKYKNFDKDDWAYVENIFPNGQVEIVIHEYMGGTTKEVTATVPYYALMPIDYNWYGV